MIGRWFAALGQKVRKAAGPTLFIVSGILILLVMLVAYGIDQSQYQHLPDGSKIKLLGVTSGRHHQVSWKLFSLNNTVRKFSREFGPYVMPELTEVDTTSSVDSVVFWTRRVFNGSGVHLLSAVVVDENGMCDRLAQGPNAFAILPDRYNPTSDGVVQGWAVPCSTLLGRNLELRLFERQDTSTGTAVQLVSYHAPNATFGHASRPAVVNAEPQRLGRYNVSLVGFSSGVPYQPPGGFSEMFFRPPGGGREFFGTSVTLQITGGKDETTHLRARRVQGKSAGGVTFQTYNLVQSNIRGFMDITFAPICNRDVWDLKVDLVDERENEAKLVVLEGVRTSSAAMDEHPVEDLDYPDQWYYNTESGQDSTGDALQVQVSCGPVSGERLLCHLTSVGEGRRPMTLASIKDENGRPVSFERDDPFTVRCWLNHRAKLRLELFDWPVASASFQVEPQILLPQVVTPEEAESS